jgi:hypothetical protein
MRLFAVLCLLLFQLQVLAAATLGCAHEASGLPAPTACPHSLGGAADSGDDLATADTECQKCNLNLCAAGWHLLPGQAPLLPAFEDAQPAPLPGEHYYLFSPDGLLKPPIPISG